MENPKLLITKKKYTEDSTVVSLRLPKDMLRDIDKISSDTGRTRNEILQTCLEFALTHLKENEN